MFRSVLVVGFVSLLAWFPDPAGAQDGAVSITGVVRDSTGGALPGAVVSISNQETRETTEAISDGEGAYRTIALPGGSYQIEATVDGFETAAERVQISAGQSVSVDLVLRPARLTESVVVTARRIEEAAQEVPIPLAVVSGALIENAGTFNVNRLQQVAPTIQFYTTNQRNSFLNIRGLGLPFGLANDGIEVGVGMYVDGVFHSRPAAATLDFVDVDRLEVLRGPQGTLFGKNTTAGALNITTRPPNVSGNEANFEVSSGNLGFVQAKGSVSGPLSSKVAGRLSFSVTTRNGTLRNVRTGEDVNTLDNKGVRGQLRFLPSRGVVITFAADYNRQRPNGYAPVIAGVAPTRRAANRQFPQIAADLGYSLPSTNPFDRLIDTDTPWQGEQDYGGASLTADWNIGRGQLTAITSWRTWDWGPSNDRDFTGLPVTIISGAPSLQTQWTQEVRYAADVSPRLDFVVGLFGFQQSLDGTITLESGPAAARWNLAPSAAAATPGLLEGYGQRATVDLKNTSAALFGQVQWRVTDRLRVLPGLRVNYDRKKGAYDQSIYGGLQTTNPALIALQRSIYAPASYDADVSDTNLSGQLTVSYAVNDSVNTYATYATAFKSVGLNVAGGLPIIPATGLPDPSAAVIRPEDERHVELGVKTTPAPGVTANFSLYNTDVKDYQTTVFGGDPSALRGYLANAEKVRVRGVELEGSAAVTERLSLQGTATYADGKNVVFTKAPAALEDTGGPQFIDISGSDLAGLSEWAFSLGGDYHHPIGRGREIFTGFDTTYRSSFSSNPTPSNFLAIDGYALLNTRVGFRLANGWSVSVWARNLLDKDYYEMLNPVGGNTGLSVGFLGDPRTYGITVRTPIGSR
ncbi:MAG: TonB-dependent receptor [Vicinamibacterales bacterium]